MEQEQFNKILAGVKKWMKHLLVRYEPRMEPMAEVGPFNLDRYYPADMLRSVKRVIVDRCPVPPLAATGIDQLAEIENWELKGIPWGNIIFIRRDLENWEAVHFHEILHAVQWQCLGADRYLTAWAIGTIIRGYRDNPLEEMAFRFQSQFETEDKSFDVVKEVSGEIEKWPESYFDIERIH